MTDPDDTTQAEKGFLDRHPKLGILLIAAVFYVILIGMCAATAVLVWTQ